MSEANAHNEALVLDEELTIAQSAQYYQQFMACIERGGDIELDASAVSRIDAAFIQLLFVVKRTLAETGRGLRWRAVSPALTESVALLGMSEQLSVPGKI